MSDIEKIVEILTDAGIPYQGSTTAGYLNVNGAKFKFHGDGDLADVLGNYGDEDGLEEGEGEAA